MANALMLFACKGLRSAANLFMQGKYCKVHVQCSPAWQGFCRQEASYTCSILVLANAVVEKSHTSRLCLIAFALNILRRTSNPGATTV